MDDAFLRRPHDKRLGGPQSRGSGFLIAGSNRFLDLPNISSHLTAARPVDGGPPCNFTNGLFGRGCIRHLKDPGNEVIEASQIALTKAASKAQEARLIVGKG
jgi:hypothetical protein